MPETCANCQSFVPFHDAPEEGTCHHEPPKAQLIGSTVKSYWPSVKATEWCRKHEERPKEIVSIQRGTTVEMLGAKDDDNVPIN